MSNVNLKLKEEAVRENSFLLFLFLHLLISVNIKYWIIPKESILWCKKTIGCFKKGNTYKSIVENTIRGMDRVDQKVRVDFNLYDYFIPPISHKRQRDDKERR